MSQGSPYLSQILAAIFPNISGLKSTNVYSLALLHFFQYILTISLLPNRLPLKELPQVVARVPWDDLPSISSLPQGNYSLPSSLSELVSLLPSSSAPHVLANLIAFLTPRYAKLFSQTLASYLVLYSELLGSIEPGVLEPIKIRQEVSSTTVVRRTSADDSDSDDAMDVDVRPTELPPQPQWPVLDSRTMNRLNSLPSLASVSALLASTSRSSTARLEFFR